MNKSDLITMLSARENLTEADASRIVHHVLDGFAAALKNGGRIEIRGFGVFTVREYDGYRGRNPKTGEVVEVKPKKGVFFKVGRGLKKIVDGGNPASTRQNSVL